MQSYRVRHVFLRCAHFYESKLSTETVSDATVFVKYSAVRHHSFCLLEHICENHGVSFCEVADVFLLSERRTVVVKSRETITRGKVVKIRFRAQFRDKETRGAHKPKLRAMPL